MKIMHDAGHGANTPGKRAPDGSLREFEFTSAVVEYTVEEMRRTYTGVEHLLAHDPTGRVDVPLQERTDKANREQVDVYVSYHANAYGSDWNSVRGTETYVYTTRTREEVELAELVQRNLISDLGTVNRGVKSANFHVLRETNMPSILMEFEFMTNREALALLKSEEFRRACARSVSGSLGEFYELTARTTGGEEEMETDTTRYRLVTGTFPNAQAFADALERFEARFSWLKYERADSTNFDPTYRIVTGTFTGRESAERAAEQIREAFGWIVYVEEA
ncbi:N-acetylmuramoyl-L-alanine amidase family protein [Bacillus fonticola]|uniref:N-acetylmuramoyl-L-alanine amidase family protein n=1 Tax=Bacillus fonticola TaxID=2728853 RepID=UPI001472FD3B|nr:N-acetylmuramoyl-L-alanine amidase [Bacillus fonticola]